MKALKKVAILGMSLSVTLSSYCLAQEITIATGEFPPLYTAKSETNGLVLHLVKEAFAAEGITANFQFVPWKRASENTKNATVDASCCWFITDERAKYAEFSEPVFIDSYSFFHLKTTDFNWDTIEDLKGYRIGATLGYAYSKEFTDAEKAKTISVQRGADDNDNLKKLFGKRIDIVLLNNDTGYYSLKTKFSADHLAKITHHPKPLLTSDIHLMFPKSKPNTPQLMESLKKGLATIKSNGRYQKIVDDYEKQRSQ